ncbi:TetR/AcrR family transcriptional regulator [Mycobacteroides abscessus]|uniref:TetR/AcrR family transcriptional regulator n=1 Tax=Mycobacteroides abscessus TaxID=36809 RepID=A0ABD7HPU3_9MYCO|nr:TetR/AcrR family transcriptional regulator [Mycobacteroides abscessus]AWG62978.1 TetR/AcrR family transcriptional regulator [Mycobacteroides abscessus]PVA29577.1 TetR/AcrR family transcriptional regulator [Mycobacteroides abscessus]PVA43484.1 TetR/AcrR family transcriptional regulator [Mycobacteroides abscessus]PVA73563.1 TetR/AcrR family transcriptional regulator [Mycobacteroides abscessus]PVB12097.1 TetR/AcrR family transcriptional regulator [Mycobacteroides abscessus]
MASDGAVADGRTLRWEHRRPELLSAVTEYVLANGVAGLTMRPLAEGVGVTIATLIRQFGSKDQLVEEVCRGIHATTLETLISDPELNGLSPRDTLNALWARWLDPVQARPFVFLFELLGMSFREPDRYRWFSTSIVADWLAPIEAALISEGKSAGEARIVATAVLALIRGLQMDLATTGDRSRVDAAYGAAIDALAARW